LKILVEELHSLVAISVKNKTSGQISLMTVAWNFLAVHVPRKRGFEETMLSETATTLEQIEGYSKEGKVCEIRGWMMDHPERNGVYKEETRVESFSRGSPVCR